MKRFNTEKFLKRSFSGALASAVVISQLVSGGVTAFAADAATGDVITFADGGITGGFDTNFAYKTTPKTLETGDLEDKDDNLLPDYATAFGDDVPIGQAFTWVGDDSETTAYDPATTQYKDLAVDSNALTLTATLTPIDYKISYDKNGGEGTIADTTYQYHATDKATLSDGTGFTRADYDLVGWSLDKDRDAADFDVTKNEDDFALSGDYEKKNATDVTFYAVWEITPDGAAKEAAAAADEAAADAEAAAKKADEAAAAAEKNPTADTVKAAKEAAEKATAAAKAATEAAKAATEASKVSGVTKDVKELAEKSAAAATKAAGTATASAKKATDAATAAQKKIDDDAAAAQKSDGSTKENPAPKGNALKDADGKEIGFVVTSDDKNNPEAEYKGLDVDKSASKITIPDEVKDQNGHVYKVTSIAPEALKNAKGKSLVLGKNIKKIGKNACKGAKFKSITLKTAKKAKITIGKGAFKVKNKKCVIKIKGAKGTYKTKLVKKIKKQATKGVTVK